MLIPFHKDFRLENIITHHTILSVCDYLSIPESRRFQMLQYIPFGPGVAIWRQESESALAQRMVWCGPRARPSAVPMLTFRHWFNKCLCMPIPFHKDFRHEYIITHHTILSVCDYLSMPEFRRFTMLQYIPFQWAWCRYMASIIWVSRFSTADGLARNPRQAISCANADFSSLTP